eukprot:scaffold43507_cov56-Phaeocystis_antarctica.AAC.3
MSCKTRPFCADTMLAKVIAEPSPTCDSRWGVIPRTATADAPRAVAGASHAKVTADSASSVARVPLGAVRRGAHIAGRGSARLHIRARLHRPPPEPRCVGRRPGRRASRARPFRTRPPPPPQAGDERIAWGDAWMASCASSSEAGAQSSASAQPRAGSRRRGVDPHGPPCPPVASPRSRLASARNPTRPASSLCCSARPLQGPACPSDSSGSKSCSCYRPPICCCCSSSRGNPCFVNCVVPRAGRMVGVPHCSRSRRGQ